MNLTEAIIRNNQEEFFRLLKLKTDAFGKNVIDETDAEYNLGALCYAIISGHAHFIYPLVKAGAEVNKKNEGGSTPVWIAAYFGCAEAIIALEAVGAAVNIPNNSGATPVWAAASKGHAEVITALKALGAAVDTPDNSGTTPVWAAAFNGHTKAIHALKAAGANMDTPDNDGLTPVFIAARDGHAKAITALKAAGANIDTPANDGATPVFVAAYHGHTEAITALKAAGANMDTPANDGATPVHAAAENGQAEAIAVLGTAGVNMDASDNNGLTPVFVAAYYGHTEAITALLKAEANARIKANREKALKQVSKGKEAEHKKIVSMANVAFENKITTVLGKLIGDPKIRTLFDELEQLPKIDACDLGLPDDSIEYGFPDLGILFMFSKKGRLTSAMVYFSDHNNYKKFKGYYNKTIQEGTTKKQLIQRYGAPTHENNIIDYSYGLITPRWISYDYERYSVTYSFSGSADILSDVAIMHPDVVPSRRSRQ